MAPILDLHHAGIESRSDATTTVAPRPRISSSPCGCCACVRGHRRSLILVHAAYALRAATLAGAKAVHLDGQVGALKAGMAADLMIFYLNEPAFVPLNSAVRQIVYAEAGRAVETVLVAGRPVVRDGKLVTVDEAALAAEAAENCRPACAARWRRWLGEKRRPHSAAARRQPRRLEGGHRPRALRRPGGGLASPRNSLTSPRLRGEVDSEAAGEGVSPIERS